MREQDVVLEDQARVPALGGHAQAAACVLKQLAVEGDTAFHILQAGEGSQESRLAGSVRTQHCDGLACRCGERDIEPEAVAFCGIERPHCRANQVSVNVLRNGSAAAAIERTPRASERWA